MTSYTKAAICAGLIFIYCLAVFLLISSDSTSGDEKALLYFKESKYKMAFCYVEELEKDSNSYKYPLFQGYILREDQNIEKSTFFFKKALKPQKNGKNLKNLIEIRLNLALNAYLSNDINAFQEEIFCLQQLQNSNNNLGKSIAYIDLFKALAAVLDKDHKKALIYFQKHQTYVALSPWMKHSFKKYFTHNFIEFQIIHCLIETSQFKRAHQMLDNQKIELDKAYFLEAFVYFKENKINYLEELKKIENKKLVVNAFNKTLLKLEKDFYSAAEKNEWDQFSDHFFFLNEILSEENMQSLSQTLGQEIDRKLTLNMPVEALKLINKTTGALHVKLLYNTNQMMEQTLHKKEFEKLENYIHLNKNLNQPTSEKFINDISDFALEMASSNQDAVEHILSCVDLWRALEKSEAKKMIFAKQLIAAAKSLWIVNKQYETANLLFEAAYKIPEDKSDVLESLECTLSHIHKIALKEDSVQEYFPILHIVKILKLKAVNIYDEQEKNQLLDDAKYFFSRALYDKAYERASFVVAIDMKNSEACKIAGLCAFELGNFALASKNLKLIQNPDLKVLKTLQIIEPKPN